MRVVLIYVVILTASAKLSSLRVNEVLYLTLLNLDKLITIIFVSPVSPLFLVFKFNGVLTVLCEKLTNTSSIIAIELVIVRET